jgi:hypothetical protein
MGGVLGQYSEAVVVLIQERSRKLPLHHWKDAGPDVPILKQAKVEDSRLQ